MSIVKINAEEFVRFAATHVVVDVRSPGEHAHAHIPGAASLAIFNDEERKIIGTAYKQQSRQIAIKLGLDFFGKHMVTMVEAAERLLAKHPHASRNIGVHCWRGGMRSGAVAWLLNLYGFNVYLLEGGYKSYRHWVLQQMEKKYSLKILGGHSGANKTGILHEMKKRGEAVIDLEQLAGHQGSAFGNLDSIPQPGQEQFENLLAQQLYQLSGYDAIWLEAESQRLGNVNIPMVFLESMRSSPLYFLNIPFEQRVAHCVAAYGHHDKASLIAGILRIKKRLGGLETKNTINFLLEDDLHASFAILMRYYDKVYLKSTFSRENVDELISYIDSDTVDCQVNLKKILEHDRNQRH